VAIHVPGDLGVAEVAPGGLKLDHLGVQVSQKRGGIVEVWRCGGFHTPLRLKALMRKTRFVLNRENYGSFLKIISVFCGEVWRPPHSSTLLAL
jgi:hypothetical protein